MKKTPYIVIIGPDGCGKTTIVEHLVYKLIKYGNVNLYCFSFGILPSISTILKRQKHSDTDSKILNSGMVTPLHTFKSSILACWYGVDHVLGRFMIGYNKKRSVILFARSYHDFFYQRAYINLPKFIPKLFLFFGPKPDCIFVLVRSPSEIYSVKPELDCVEIDNQYKRIDISFGYCRNYYKIDASNGVDNALFSIMEVVNSLII